MSHTLDAQEVLAVVTLMSRGIALDPTPCQPHPGDCTMCTFHAFDADGQELDGGSASALLSWIEQGYLTDVATIRLVSRKPAPVVRDCHADG